MAEGSILGIVGKNPNVANNPDSDRDQFIATLCWMGRIAHGQSPSRPQHELDYALLDGPDGVTNHHRLLIQLRTGSSKYLKEMLATIIVAVQAPKKPIARLPVSPTSTRSVEYMMTPWIRYMP